MKNVLKLGRALTKSEQQRIKGGNGDPPPGFPPSCSPGDAYILPSCSSEQQSLADSGDPYWLCVCGYSTTGISSSFPWKFKGTIV